MLIGRAMTQLARVLEEIRGRKNLRVLASDIQLLAADLLGGTKIDDLADPRLYNAVNVQHEGLRFEALTWRQSAWGSSPTHSRVLDCLMHCLTCAALGEESMLSSARGWLRIAVEQNAETRPHFTQSFREQLSRGDFTTKLLTTVSELRSCYDGLDDDLGPYPPESFPFHFFAPEEYLVHQSGAPKLEKRALWPQVEELLVILATEV